MFEERLENQPKDFDGPPTFLYGTLATGCSNHWVLRDIELQGHARKLCVAEMRDMVLCDIGGLPAMYRVYMPEEVLEWYPDVWSKYNIGPRTVLGELWDISPAGLEILDQFEGSPYFYKRKAIPSADVARRDGEKINSREVFAYMGPDARSPMPWMRDMGNSQVIVSRVILPLQGDPQLEQSASEPVDWSSYMEFPEDYERHEAYFWRRRVIDEPTQLRIDDILMQMEDEMMELDEMEDEG